MAGSRSQIFAQRLANGPVSVAHLFWAVTAEILSNPSEFGDGSSQAKSITVA